jgi:hypothetical protein
MLYGSGFLILPESIRPFHFKPVGRFAMPVRRRLIAATIGAISSSKFVFLIEDGFR